MRAVGNLQFLKDEDRLERLAVRRPVSATRAGRRTAASPRRTRIRSSACDDAKLSIVLNGIVENYRELRDELLAAGHTFRSETDAEVVAHLLEEAYDGDLVAAVRAAYARLEGHFTFVVDPSRPSEPPRRRASSDADGRRARRRRELPRLEPRGVPRRDAARAVPGRRRDRLDQARTRSRSSMRRPASRSSTT